MKHPDWPLFLAAIIAEPDEDTPRLVAADFLEENGEPDRAAFIRIQIELARLEASGMRNSREADEWRKKERAFLGPLSVYPHLWAAVECPELVQMPGSGRTGSPLAHMRVEGVERLTWRRGFVESVTCPAAEWLRHGVAVRRRNPVREVIMLGSHDPPRDAWYAGLASLRGLRSIELRAQDTQTEEDVAGWLRPWLPGTTITWLPC
jgi:uncharacterized protein (TIGR02996 family)